MGFFEKLFGSRRQQTTPQFTQRDIQVIGDSAHRYVEVINESLQLANTSKNPATKISRLNVAKVKLEELKVLVAQYPFLDLTFLPEVESDIAKLEVEFLGAGYKELAEGNSRGKELEGEGRIDEAITQYEALVSRGTDTPFTYKRLAILYKKRKSPQDEERVVQAAIAAIDQDSTHLKWFRERLTKIKY
jgi:hypothetical protein